MVRLSVIIVSYNVRYYLEQCIRSVIQASDMNETEIWVVDNASTDGSVEYLQTRYPEVHYIANKENHGFSYANNQAIRQCKGEYVLLLNPDTIVSEDTIVGCMQFLDNRPSTGAVGVRMLHADGSFAPESRRGLPTPFTSFCKMTGLGTLFPNSRIFGRYYMRYLDVEKPHPIEVISGAFCMVRHSVLDKIGLLDETFFMYGEDIDLSYRILQAGWENYYLPFSILHYKGESTAKSSFRYVHVFYNAMLIFFNKHFGRRYRLLGYLIRLAVLGRAFLDILIRMVGRVRRILHIPVRKEVVRYISFDFDTTPVKQILHTLRRQPSGRRCSLETVSHKAGVIIRSSEVLPLTDEEGGAEC